MAYLEYTISNALCGKQIGEILKLLGVSTQLRKFLRNEVLADGVAVPSHFIPTLGQTITIPLPEDPPSPITPVAGDLCLLYEDDHLLVLNKPAGVPVHPGPDHHEDTIGNYVTHYYLQKGDPHLFRPVNRLDKGTSGLMVVAKHQFAADRLRQQLHSNEFRRSYLALCHGRLTDASGSIDAPIGRKEGSVIERKVRPDGKSAVTHFQVTQYYVDCTLVELTLENGRTHQIRVHMAHLGHPLVGDFLYGTEEPDRIGRTALHSHKLEFFHPVTHAPLSFTDPLPEDIIKAAR